MRPMPKAALLSLVCALSACAAMPAVSMAARWKVAGKILEKSSEKAVSGYEGDKLTIVAVRLTEVTCQVVDLDTLIGGSPGTDEFTVLAFAGCSDSTPFCAVEAISAKRLNYQSELSESGGKFFDLVKSLAIEFKLSGASCSIAGSYVLEENAEGEFEDATNTLVFPSTPLSGSDLVINDLTTLHGYGGRLVGSMYFPSVEVVK